MNQEPYMITMAELDKLGRGAIPPELVSSAHLIYSSPATLSFNSPGAQGYGVKRAGLAIPGSVMLLVSPGCCGRNTTLLRELPGYENRFFFLLLDETDIVTGRHLKKIPQAVKEVCQSLKEQPSMVMICMTCVDALLGTDMERVCRKAVQEAGLPVVPCYMYALTREGRKPPMVAVRQAVYSLLEPLPKDNRAVNLLGNFAPLFDDCELYALLKQMGIQTIREIGRCQDFPSYKAMASANFNLVLDAEARLAAQDLEQRLSIPFIELTRLYQLDKIRNQYAIFAKALGASIDDQAWYDEAEQAMAEFKEAYGDAVFAVGDMMNGNPFELSLALVRQGLRVAKIYANVSTGDFVHIRHLAALSPDTEIYANLAPSMLHYDGSADAIDITIGEDSLYYYPDLPNVPWRDAEQPFGYSGVMHLFRRLKAALDTARRT